MEEVLELETDSAGIGNDQGRAARRHESDPLHGEPTARTTQRFGFYGRSWSGRGCRQELVEDADQLPDFLQRNCEVGREEAEVPEFDEALGEDVLEKTADELESR